MARMFGPDVNDAWSIVKSRDGTRIAWTRNGPTPSSDPTPVVLCNGIACSDAYWHDVVPPLAEEREVLRWDYRGHGRSDNPVDRSAISLDAFVDDLEHVLDAAEVSSSVLVGHSFGVQVVLEAYRRFPDRVTAVVCIAGAASRPLTRGQENTGGGENLLTALQRFVSTTPRLASRTWDTVWDSPSVHRLARLLGGTTSAAPSDVMSAYFAHVRDRDPELLFDMLGVMQAHRADDVLTTIDVPLLVLAGDRDRLTPLPVLTEMALTAPQGELAVRHGAAHTLPAEYPAWVAEEILRFLQQRVLATNDRASA